MDRRTVLCVDVGNTRTHFGLFEGDRLLKKSVCRTGQLRVPKWKADAIVYASVVPGVNKALQKLGAVPVKPAIVNRARRPSEVGIDRLCHAAAAWHKYKRSCMVVSLGTAITFNVVSDQGEFLGGLIAPGIKMMARMLHDGTAQLPLVRPKRSALLYGDTTVGSINLGIQWCVEGLLRRREQSFATIPVIGTGGDAAEYAEFFDQVDLDLTLRGIALSYLSS